ncbi:MAG: hypothetical protein WDN67_02895 [Candidatus Moraniibacteriota bacterium]
MAFAATRQVGSLWSIALHTVFFVGIFALSFAGFSLDQILLILTTAVSLEAIYLAIFIQMSVNRQAVQIAEVSEEVEEISEDVEEISKDIDEIQEEVEDLGEEIERDDQEDAKEHADNVERIAKIEDMLGQLLGEVKNLKGK